MTGAGVWHINEDESDALDYNLDFGRPADFFDSSVPFRCSDHSPVLVGLNMAGNDGGDSSQCSKLFSFQWIFIYLWILYY